MTEKDYSVLNQYSYLNIFRNFLNFLYLSKIFETFIPFIYLYIRIQKKKGSVYLKQKLYDKLVAYILENQNKFYRLAFSYVKNQDDALDVVQNAVCKALTHYMDLRNEKAIKTWFYKIVLNESFALLNTKKKVILTGESNYCEIPYEEKGLEIHDDLYDQINQMEKDTQNIIKLRFFEELELNEIALILGMNLNTVKTKLYRGLKALKVVMEKEESI